MYNAAQKAMSIHSIFLTHLQHEATIRAILKEYYNYIITMK